VFQQNPGRQTDHNNEQQLIREKNNQHKRDESEQLYKSKQSIPLEGQWLSCHLAALILYH